MRKSNPIIKRRANSVDSLRKNEKDKTLIIEQVNDSVAVIRFENFFNKDIKDKIKLLPGARFE